MNRFGHIKHAAVSDVGRKRRNNEDAYGVFPEAGIFCVADGMGGGDDGEVASAATVRAVEVFTEANPLPPLQTFTVDSMIAGLRGAINSASSWIAKRAREKHLKGCGSTFAGVCFDASDPGTAVALHAGDSRVYRIRGKSVKQITKDHSAAELIGAKDENDINPMFRGMILRAVGIQDRTEVDSTPFPVSKGDRVLICSDGLSKVVADKRIASVVKDSATVDEAARRLTDAANEAGGPDNITVVMLEVGNLPAALPAVEMPAPHVVESGECCPVSDGHTLDTNAETAVSFGFSSSSSSSTVSGGEHSGTSTGSALMIPEDDTEEHDNRTIPGEAAGEFRTEADMKSSMRSAEVSSRKRMSVIAFSVVAVFAVLVFAFIGLTGGGRDGVPQQVESGQAEAEAARKCAEEAERSEAARREREAAAAEKARLEREAEAARKRAEEAERAEAARREREAAAAEKARLEREAEAARKRAEEAERAEAARREQEAESARRREEAERLHREKLERERAEKEKALAARLAKEKEQATLKRRRKAAFSALRRVCEDKSATAFVRKVMVLVKEELWDSICRDFRPVVTAMTEEASLKAASDLARKMQPVIVRLSEYADVYQSDAENELKDPLTTVDYRKELLEVPAKMKEFRRNAARIIGRDVTDPDVHMACALMIEMVPLWF